MCSWGPGSVKVEDPPTDIEMVTVADLHELLGGKQTAIPHRTVRAQVVHIHLAVLVAHKHAVGTAGLGLIEKDVANGRMPADDDRISASLQRVFLHQEAIADMLQACLGRPTCGPIWEAEVNAIA